MDEEMKLADLKTGEEGIILKVKGRGAFRKRIIEMGFVKGKTVSVIKNAPLHDPIEYKIMDYYVSLRRNEAQLIEIQKTVSSYEQEKDARPAEEKKHHLRDLLHQGKGQADETAPYVSTASDGAEQTINIALVGNPNCGKTTLFNLISGSHERVGNYSGVTVGAKEAELTAFGYKFRIADLPGTYSITEYTPEELYVRNYIFEKMPDVVINVIDSSNIERNLYLTTQLIDMDIKVVAALNMFDELEKLGDRFDYKQLGDMIGIPFIPTVSTNGTGIDELLKKVIDVFEDRDESIRHIHINYSPEIERSISAIQKTIWTEENASLTDSISSRFLAVKLLEKDKPAEEKIFNSCANRTEIFRAAATETRRLEQLMNEDSESIISNAKYAFIAGALKETYTMAKRPKVSGTDRIDNILTHPVLGLPIFIFFIWLMFQLTFILGEYPMSWIDKGVGLLSGFISAVMPAGQLKDLITDGILAGIGGVIVFLPNILILFFMISFMEDTGYMARAAFIMDRIMHRIGLHGRSFIPMLMGFGCNVPAVMATRTIDGRNDRLLTMLIIPFMSCSARLPLYTLFIGAFFYSHAGTLLFLIYLAGISAAAVSALILKRIFFKKNEIPFVMELPPYRMPKASAIARHMWEKAVEYLKKIGGIILAASVIIWALSRYPSDIEYSKDYKAEEVHAEQEYTAGMKAAGSDEEKQILTEAYSRQIRLLRAQERSERTEKSYIGRTGKFIEPVLAPLGFDWKMSISLVTGLAAKEIVVGTMGILYHTDTDTEENQKNLQKAITEPGHSGQTPVSRQAALAFIFFVLLYFPCLATIAAIRREAGSWKWALFAAGYTTAVAWIISFAVYNTGKIIF